MLTFKLQINIISMLEKNLVVECKMLLRLMRAGQERKFF